MKKIILTGAAGRLGSYLREPLLEMANELVSTDLVDDFGKVFWINDLGFGVTPAVSLLLPFFSDMWFGVLKKPNCVDLELLSCFCCGLRNFFTSVGMNGFSNVLCCGDLNGFVPNLIDLKFWFCGFEFFLSAKAFERSDIGCPPPMKGVGVRIYELLFDWNYCWSTDFSFSIFSLATLSRVEFFFISFSFVTFFLDTPAWIRDTSHKLSNQDGCLSGEGSIMLSFVAKVPPLFMLLMVLSSRSWPGICEMIWLFWKWML